MNKFIVIGIVLVLIVVGGIAWKQFGVKGDNRPIETGVVKEMTIVSKKLEWRYEPEKIEVEQGDRLLLTVINEDDFDHGFAIDALGVSQRLPANGTINVDVVASKSGVFPFYCSVSCSDSRSTGNLPGGVIQTGPYAGKVRGHFDHVGELIVKAAKAVVGQ